MAMLNKPQFKRCFHRETVEKEGVFLLSEQDAFFLEDKIYWEIIPAIDGINTADEIVDKLEDRIPAAEIYYALMQMERQGYIVEADSSLPEVEAAFWEGLNASQDAKHRLQTTKVAVRAIGNLISDKIRDQFLQNLESIDIQVAEVGDIEIVLTDDYLQPDLETFNHKALQSQRPWMLVKPVGQVIWLGPIFHPDKTACWECLAKRLRDNRPVESFIQKRLNKATAFPTSKPVLPTTLQTGLSLAATEIAKWVVTGENEQLTGQIVTLDTLTLDKQIHVAVKRPQCKSCGNPEYWSPRHPEPVLLESRKKNFTADGGHRSSSPEATIKKYGHQIGAIAGVVRALVPVPSGDTNLTPSYVAGHNFARISDSLYFLRENVRGQSGGKGKTDAQAKASGFGEAIERYSGVFQGYEIRKTASYVDLGEVAVHPYECMMFSEAQYQNRASWNDECDRPQVVPEPFDETQQIEWTPLWSLTHQTWKYLPTEYCYYAYQSGEKPFCIANSNGCAAGNNIEEAILQGFMELAERDAVSMWWYNRIQRPAVDLETFGDRYFQDLKTYYQSINRSLWVIDITCDLNIPTFAAISARTDKPVEDILYGFGAHFDPKIAVNRALTEVNQCLPAVSTANADGSIKYPESDKLAKSWWQKATLKNQPYLLPDPGVAPKTYSDFIQLAGDDIKTDVMTCVEIVQKQGMEVLVLDQTRPDIGLNVARVVVPGMRMFWKRLGPGRLYEVPVKLGWLPAPLPENQLNPFPIWF
jgi:ribosomal protein S12 methylthiotransferase accessory factor